MTTEWGLVAAIATQVIIFAAAWGDLRRQVAGNLERTNELHSENRETLKEIGDDVKRINGTVREHHSTLADHEREIDRLRQRRRGDP